MTACILTVIKNEHPYLNEWIDYHLKLGVSKIFILEDIDSQSHQHIIENYGGKVFLAPALSILSSADRDLVITNRKQCKPGGQKTYIKAGLQYIQTNFNYDWCFVIDNDEFLTLQNDVVIDTILHNFSNYDAFIMSWQSYGANGYIAKPDYTKQGVVGTFNKPIQGYIPASSNENNKKTCYNLHTFRREFWKTIHVPTNVCNFCNTRYEKDRVSICLDLIYVRHYITKSLEEYYWKKQIRGYFYGAVRTPNAFFAMNPNLLPIKNDILHPETLVVLPYVQSKSQGTELRLALTGWRKHCTFPYHFVVIGEFNADLCKEFPWVEFISAPILPRVSGQYNPHLDIRNKFEITYQRFHDRYPGFIYMVDDNYAIRPFTKFDIFQTHYLNPSFSGVEKLPTYFWKHDKWKTRQLLDANNLPHINYTTHFPCYFNFNNLTLIWDRFEMRNESYVPEDIYFNVFNVSTPVPVSPIRYGIWGPKQMGEPLEAAIANPNIKFLCNSVEGWSSELERILSNLILESNP